MRLVRFKRSACDVGADAPHDLMIGMTVMFVRRNQRRALGGSLLERLEVFQGQHHDRALILPGDDDRRVVITNLLHRLGEVAFQRLHLSRRPASKGEGLLGDGQQARGLDPVGANVPHRLA